MEIDQNTKARTIIAFGRFRLFKRDRLLFYDEDKVDIGSRAFDVLHLLVRKQGSLISHKEFYQEVWPNVIVEAVNLRVQIAALRKLLAMDEGRTQVIKSIPGRGYCFLGMDEPQSGFPAASQDDSERYLGERGPLIGRQKDVGEIRRLLIERRVVSLVGPGGVGKSAVAQGVLRNLPELSGFSLLRVDLAAATETTSIAAIVEAHFMGSAESGPMHASITDVLRTTPHLLFFDNCDDARDTLSLFVETLTASIADIRILATSREPLRVAEERVYRINPFDVAHLSDRASPEERVASHAVRFFIERALALHSNDIELDDESCSNIVEICRTLDGLPLAIEFAASQMNVRSVAGLFDTMGDWDVFLDREHKHALPKHRTLRHVIDTSYNALSHSERVLFRAVSLFGGSFTLRQAGAAAGVGESGQDALADSIAALLDKSLLSVIPKSQPRQFILLNTVRAYGVAKLKSHGEHLDAVKRYAQFIVFVLNGPAPRPPYYGEMDVVTTDSAMLADVRDVFDELVADGRFIALAVSLIWSSRDVFCRLSLHEEYRCRLNRALRIFSDFAEDACSTAQLQRALSKTDLYKPTTPNPLVTKERLVATERVYRPSFSNEAGTKGIANGLINA